MTLLVVPAVLFVVAFLAEVERCHGYIEMPLFNDGFHVTEEEGHNQCSDMCAIDVGIRHDDNLVVTYLREIECLGVLGCADGDTEGCEDIANLLALEHLVFHGLLYVEYFSSQWQYGLVETVATCLGSTACRITLDEEEFA